jgi:hypothetical protein
MIAKVDNSTSNEDANCCPEQKRSNRFGWNRYTIPEAHQVRALGQKRNILHNWEK